MTRKLQPKVVFSSAAKSVGFEGNSSKELKIRSRCQLRDAYAP